MDIKEQGFASPIKENLPIPLPKYEFDIDEEEDTSFKGRLKAFSQYHEYLTAFILSTVIFSFIFGFCCLLNLDKEERTKLNIELIVYYSFTTIAIFIGSFFSTKLSLATKSGYLNIIDEELRKGVNINVTNVLEKSTPIFQAVQSGRLRTVKFLIERGADIHSFDTNGYTTLHYARTAKMADYLLFLGVQVDETRNILRLTPLLHAIIFYKPEVAELLVERGANVNLENTSEMSALSLALTNTSKSRDFTSAIEAILRAGADTRHSFSHCCIRYESCESYAKRWNSSTINSLIAKINPYISNI